MPADGSSSDFAPPLQGALHASGGGRPATPVRVAIITLDSHLAGAVRHAEAVLRREIPGLSLSLHAAADFADSPASLAETRRAIAAADILIVTMMFMDDHIRLVQADLEARREACDAIVCCLSAAEVVKLTRLGSFRMDVPQKGPLALLKRLRGKPQGDNASASSGAGQMAMLRRLPKILKYIPGTAQDVRAYFLTLSYWLSGSQENVGNLVRFMIDRYAAGPRQAYRGTLKPRDPAEYPEVGVYHPRLPQRLASDAGALVPLAPAAKVGTVGLLILRSYVLAEDTAHYDGVIAALEAQGLEVIPAFASGLDARPAIEAFFEREAARDKDAAPHARIDALVSLTGFSLVGGPAYNDAAAAEACLSRLDVPYIAAHPLEFQSLERWASGHGGLSPVESTIMVAIPELDGATQPLVFGGRSDCSGEACTGCGKACRFEPLDNPARMQSCAERAETLAARVAKAVRLRRTPAADRRVGVVLFNFPPNSGAVGSAAWLGVFESLHHTLKSLAAEGYTVEVPDTVEDLRHSLLDGNSAQFNTDANVHARISLDDHVRTEPFLKDIEAVWGAAPGRALTDGRSLFVLGRRFGNVFVGLQPGMGSEGDPMRLMFEGGHAPTHAFSAFYRYLRQRFDAHAVLHFGTHGALEFMPGKQVGLSGQCWPDRLIGDLPNLYLYAANNPSEGAIARRRSGATLVSYLTPPVTEAGLNRQLGDLREAITRWRGLDPDEDALAASLEAFIREQARALDLGTSQNAGAIEVAEALERLERTLIPSGLHVIGRPPGEAERLDLLAAMAEGQPGPSIPRPVLAALVAGAAPRSALAQLGVTQSGVVKSGVAETPALLDRLEGLARSARLLAEDHETRAILKALAGRYIPPAPGGDLLRTPDVLPTGRNLHGFDPFRLPSSFAVRDGERQAAQVLARHKANTGEMPRTVALVLWGTDNLKSEGAPIAQALALMGARPRLDSYGRVCGAELVPLAELDRPRIDVVMTLSGIFRDLLPLQTKMLAEAAYLAATSDEPSDRNFIRANTLAHMEAQGCDLETAALRVFSNADGSYGANVNQLIDSGLWQGEDDLADAYEARKSFAYGRSGKPQAQGKLLSQVLAGVDFAYQNLESLELGVTTIDHYVDTLGGISRAVTRARGKPAPVYICDQTAGSGQVRTLAEQVAVETHTRTLNARWYEGLLKHGYEGVRQIEAQITNTFGWSATTGEVTPWVYEQITQTYLLDPAMRERLASLNPRASVRMANRMIEAHERRYWTPDAETLAALRQASAELEDRLEGLPPPPATGFAPSSPAAPQPALPAL